MKSKPSIADQFRRDKGRSEKHLQAQWENTRTCQAFYAGNQMNYQDTVYYGGLLGPRKSQMVSFHYVKPYINAVRGFMAQNRRQADYVARIPDKQGQMLYSEWANSLKDYVRENANADQTETSQDGDMLICGYGAVETAMTYGDGYSSRNPNGEIVMGRLDPRIIGWDPNARAPNLLDARYVYYKKVYDLDEALELIDGSKEDDFESQNDETQGQKIFLPNGGRYDKQQYLGSGDDDYDWEDKQNETVKVYFYQWYEIEKYYRAKNPLAKIVDPELQAFAFNRMVEIASEQDDADDDAISKNPADAYAFNPNQEIISCDLETKNKIVDLFEDSVKFETFKRRVYYTAVVSGSKVFTAYKNIDQRGFTVKFKTGDYDEENKIWFGMVNSMIDPVTYFNKSLTEMMYIIASQAKGGVMFETDAVDDVADFERKYAKTDSAIEVNNGALSGGKIQPKKEGYQSNGLEQLIPMIQGSFSDVVGVDKNFLGSSENKTETATLHRQRIKQVTTALATYFDNISLYQKEHSSLLMPMMRVLVENNNGSVFESTARDGSVEFLRMAPDNFADDYGISIREMPDSVSQQDEMQTFLMGVVNQFFSVGLNDKALMVLGIAVKYSSLDFEDQQKLIEQLQPQQQQIDPQQFAAMEQELNQLKSTVAEAETKRIMSESSLNVIRGQDIIAGIKKKVADTAKTEAETEQTQIENIIAQNQPLSNVNVNV